MNRNEQYSTWVEIDLEAIETHVRWVKDHTRAQVMAIVKADGYGHGAVAVAQAALRSGATWCGVARIEEARKLRHSGVECPLLLLGYIPPVHLEEAIRGQISLPVWSEEQIEQAAQVARRVGMPARLHLKVDTGMSRLGVQPEGAMQLARQIGRTRGVIFEGLMTHFARADEEDISSLTEQARQFRGVYAQLEREGLRPLVVHAANSAASLRVPEVHFDMLRLGIAMYGLHPSGSRPLPETFRPVLSWKAVLSQVKVLPPGRGVSYGHTYVTRSAERIGTVPVGYADGFRRMQNNQVLVGGIRVPVVGRVCMDQMMVQLDAVPDARAGDEVVLIGEQGEDRITAEEVAARWGTINYEVVCGIGARVARIYPTSRKETGESWSLQTG